MQFRCFLAYAQLFWIARSFCTSYSSKNFASFSPDQLTKQSQCIAVSNSRRLDCLMGKFASLDRILFRLSGKFAKLVT